MPQYETMKAWIEVDGVALEEFKVEVDEAKRVVQCHVASEKGKEFMVHWSWQRKSDTNGQLTVDGRQRSRGVSGWRKERHSDIDDTNLPDNPDLMGRLKFGDILMTDDESLSLQDERLVKALGSIELTVSTGTLKRSSQPVKSTRGNTGAALVAQKPVYERVKKAGTHQVVFGEVAPLRSCRVLFYQDDNESIRFIFLYRSAAILLAQGIMPPVLAAAVGSNDKSTNSPVPKQEDDENPDDEDEDERRLRALEEQAAAIASQAAEMKARLKKRKSNGRQPSLSKRLKVEEIDARMAFRPGEVIDLCDD